jgi:hypothetical protein
MMASPECGRSDRQLYEALAFFIILKGLHTLAQGKEFELWRGFSPPWIKVRSRVLVRGENGEFGPDSAEDETIRGMFRA